MPLTAEWRSFGEFDVVLVIDDTGAVRDALTADSDTLHDFLTSMSDLYNRRGDHPIEGGKRYPEPWGALVMARADTGEILDMDPERFWAGIHIWFRSRGVDYDTPIKPRTS